MAVITISREVGSDGTKIGKEVAKRLNYKYADKELIQEIVNHYDVTEFEGFYASGLGLWDKYIRGTDMILKLLNKIILSIAKSGNVVILGRGSFVILREYTDVLNVAIREPMNVRVHNVMKNENITDIVKANETMQHQEKMRLSFIENAYHVKWNLIDNFDMVFDTEKIKSSLVIEMIITAAQTLDKETSSVSGVLTSQIPVNEIIDNVVKEML